MKGHHKEVRICFTELPPRRAGMDPQKMWAVFGGYIVLGCSSEGEGCSHDDECCTRDLKCRYPGTGPAWFKKCQRL